MKADESGYLCNPDEGELRLIRTTPATTSAGKSFDWMVNRNLEEGEWRLECISADVLGLARPLEVYRARRRSNFVKPWPSTDTAEAYCPAHWADIAIGRGACGLRCRACFLVLTHRLFCDPSRHVLYENVADFELAVRKWLQKPSRANLGLGTDCSDSLLYEGVTGHARRLSPLFASTKANPRGSKLVLLTKSVNVRYLEGLPTRNVIVTFSLNPEHIADLWEGKFDDGVRVTPPIAARLEAALHAQELGFEVRWRIDPILTVDGWQDEYAGFFEEAALAGHRPLRVTLGTYRETQPSLSTFVEGWGLPPMEWQPPELEKDGMHYHVPEKRRVRIYQFMAAAIRDVWKPQSQPPIVALCKEPRSLRRRVGLDHDLCNCGPCM